MDKLAELGKVIKQRTGYDPHPFLHFSVSAIITYLLIIIPLSPTQKGDYSVVYLTVLGLIGCLGIGMLELIDRVILFRFLKLNMDTIDTVSVYFVGVMVFFILYSWVNLFFHASIAVSIVIIIFTIISGSFLSGKTAPLTTRLYHDEVQRRTEEYNAKTAD